MLPGSESQSIVAIGTALISTLKIQAHSRNLTDSAIDSKPKIVPAAMPKPRRFRSRAPPTTRPTAARPANKRRSK
jgi:hypothetical protein